VCTGYLRVHTCRQRVDVYRSLALSHLLHGSPQEWPRADLEQSALLQCTRCAALRLARPQLEVEDLDDAKIIRPPLIVLLQLDQRPT
jgi:hypothetical protein